MLEKYNIMFVHVVITAIFTSSVSIAVNTNCPRSHGSCDSCIGDVKITGYNVGVFQNCTTIYGDLTIGSDSFDRMHPHELESFSNLKRIHGVIEITATHRDFNSLVYFRQLELINCTNPYAYPLYIEDTSLQSLALDSLKKIKSHLGVVIQNNKNLCHVETINWAFLKQNLKNVIINNNGMQCKDAGIMCNDECTNDGCWGSGPHQCLQCKHFDVDNRCEGPKPSSNISTMTPPPHISCSQNQYVDSDTCKLCDNVCVNGCSGPKTTLGSNGCNSCNKILVIEDTIECIAFEEACPYGYMDEIIALENEFRLKNLTGKILCRKLRSQPLVPIENMIEQYSYKIEVICVVILTALVIIMLYIFLRFRQVCDCRKSISNIGGDYTKVKLSETEALEIIEVVPNMSRIYTINDTEIRKIKLLGRGAFGVVHEGIWKSSVSNNEIPVAIKILNNNDSSTSTKDFLAEAFIMAAIDHPNVLNLMAICVTSELMLLTQLMPLGCLLQYIRNNKARITPNAQITWSTQIAKGMSYLEEKCLVHRDLAARNVLLETPDCAKITDFGLSKFVGNKIYEQSNNNTKLPIRWLALECLEDRKFSHKSDVWAFGVTIWELLTFGEIPFKDISTRDLPVLLRCGEKLPQPLLCSSDLYVLLIRCWMLKPELRPDFKELSDIFERMTLEPNRYVTSFETLRCSPNSYKSNINIQSKQSFSSRENVMKEENLVCVHSYIEIDDLYEIDRQGYLIPINKSNKYYAIQ